MHITCNQKAYRQFIAAVNLRGKGFSKLLSTFPLFDFAGFVDVTFLSSIGFFVKWTTESRSFKKGNRFVMALVVASSKSLNINNRW